MLRTAQPQGQERDKALPPGQNLGVTAVLCEEIDRVLDCLRPVVTEPSHLHDRIFTSKLPTGDNAEIAMPLATFVRTR